MSLTSAILKILADGPATACEIIDSMPDASSHTVRATIANLRVAGRIKVVGKAAVQRRGDKPAIYALKDFAGVLRQHETPKREETPLPADGAYRIAGRITVRQIVFPGSRLGHKHIGLP